MNKKQESILIIWHKKFFSLILLFSVLLFVLSIEQTAMFFIGMLMLQWIHFYKNFKGMHEKDMKLSEFIGKRQKLKTWVWFNCLLVLPLMIYKLYSSYEIPWVLLSLAFGLLIIPIIFVSELERYTEAGKRI